MSLGFRVHKFIARHMGTWELVGLPAEIKKELHWMSWFVGFARSSLERRTLPLLFSQDAAGGSLRHDGTEKVKFAMAVGKPSLDVLELLRGRFITASKERRRVERDEALGTVFADSVPWTDAPVSLFSGETPWWMLWSKTFNFPLHINRGELKPAVLWLRVLGGAADVSGCWSNDLSDSSAATGSLVHGRSPAWGMNQDLRQRCVLEGVTGLRLCPTWTSTAAQPADVDARTDDSDEKVKPKLQKLELGPRIVLFSSIGEGLSHHEAKLTAPLVELRWDTHRGKKFHPLHRTGVDHMWGLLQSGLCAGLGWWCDCLRMPSDCEEIWLRALVTAVEGLVDMYGRSSCGAVGLIGVRRRVADGESLGEVRAKRISEERRAEFFLLQTTTPQSDSVLWWFGTAILLSRWPKEVFERALLHDRGRGRQSRDVVRCAAVQMHVPPEESGDAADGPHG